MSQNYSYSGYCKLKFTILIKKFSNPWVDSNFLIGFDSSRTFEDKGTGKIDINNQLAHCFVYLYKTIHRKIKL